MASPKCLLLLLIVSIGSLAPLVVRACTQRSGIHCLADGDRTGSAWRCPRSVFRNSIRGTRCQSNCCQCQPRRGRTRACRPSDLRPKAIIPTNPHFHCDYCPISADQQERLEQSCVRQQVLGVRRNRKPCVELDNSADDRSTAPRQRIVTQRNRVDDNSPLGVLPFGNGPRTQQNRFVTNGFGVRQSRFGFVRGGGFAQGSGSGGGGRPARFQQRSGQFRQGPFGGVQFQTQSSFARPLIG